MAIAVGDKIPDVEVRVTTEDGPKPANSLDLLGTGKVVLFAVPGAFTPGCSLQHLPGFVIKSDEIKAKGVDLIACIAVNDAFVMKAWGEDQGVTDEVLMISDGAGAFAKEADMLLDLSAAGIGIRSQRYAAILQDGVVQWLAVDSGSVDKSSAESVLEAL